MIICYYVRFKGPTKKALFNFITLSNIIGKCFFSVGIVLRDQLDKHLSYKMLLIFKL